MSASFFRRLRLAALIRRVFIRGAAHAQARVLELESRGAGPSPDVRCASEIVQWTVGAFPKQKRGRGGPPISVAASAGDQAECAWHQPQWGIASAHRLMLLPPAAMFVKSTSPLWLPRPNRHHWAVARPVLEVTPLIGGRRGPPVPTPTPGPCPPP
jgi:hypothetical protein